jgi:hypothetical protein
MNVLYFDYRGTWGSGGEFSMAHALEDVAKAVAAGGRQLIEPVQIKAGFGERKLTFIRAPGGWNFEIFKMIQ